jgi:gliding motility-associated-like protein
MRTAAAILFLSCAPAMHGTHLIGGELFYTWTGSDTYDVTLKMYRDCGPGNTNQTGFDATAEVAAYDANGVLYASWFFPLGTIEPVPIVWNNPCLSPPGTICVEEGIYSGTISLPSGSGGYTLSFQRCCRSPVVINLFDPASQGLTCAVTVPDVSVSGPNSSPHFDQYPPIALCVSQNMEFSHAATDADGDQLVYDLCAPLNGGSQFNPQPSPPLGPPFSAVTWENGYSELNMLDASPPLTIDANTGYVTLTPSLIGSFAVGVRVKEFRDGVQLSEVIRDFRFDVVTCAATVTSTITPQQTLVNNGGPNTGVCDGLTVDMQNQSNGADTWLWDFGVAGTGTDVSDQEDPSYTYPTAGTYMVTLIANPGWPCADTATSVFNVAPPVDVYFTRPAITCADEQPVVLEANGSFSTATAVTWVLGTGTAPDADQHTAHATFPGPGTFAVEVTATDFGCTNTYTDSVVIHPRPVPMFNTDTASCAPLYAQFDNTSTAWTPMSFHWSFGDETTSQEEEPMHTYLEQGYYDVSLTVSTDSGCIATETLFRPDLIQVWPQPIARFAVDRPVTDLMMPTIEVQDLSVSAYDVTFEVDGQVFDSTSFTYTFDDAGWYTVTLYAVSGLGCADSASMPVFVGGHLFFAPSAFSPDGDGVNETWHPAVKGARKYRLDVFDRWGRNVFSTTDPDEGWNAADYPIGTYAFKAWLTEWGPLEKEYNGSITLIR